MDKLNKIEKLSVSEVAEMLDCHTNTIYRYIKRGLLKAHKIGGETDNRLHWIIYNTDVDKMMRGEK
jgi:excisionase family DNA binding protein